ncbi:unnamed protein product [Adineta ricciae]|uniref:Uncharacterized protein n=1 Tax=Adineta ricciae TaxID=249248 RepID=A0A815J0Y4_ADIRI|nr:unnamed protein product [Adineta ricciae]CAF1372890.1 unnamed protein product [Adineta ricciae]
MNNENDDILQHDCFRVDIFTENGNHSREIAFYCMSEFPSKLSTVASNTSTKFTFAELSNLSVTSENLYLWSAPMNTVENYQFYLNELSFTSNSYLSEEVFYNCTFPRFGSVCQYELDSYDSKHSSLIEIMDEFYRTHIYTPMNLTCYTHLQCNRGHSSSCLDWAEICNGEIDCFDSGIDEKDCWQLEINECEDDEYRCTNGQCISKIFLRDDPTFPDCRDGSDESLGTANENNLCDEKQPLFKCEDVQCTGRTRTGSCWSHRQRVILNNLYSVKDNSTSDQCWAVFVCYGVGLYKSSLYNCSTVSGNRTHTEVIEFQCPDLFYMPIIPVLFGDIYFAYEKYKSTMDIPNLYTYPYVCYNNSRYDNYFIEAAKESHGYSTTIFNNRTCHRLYEPWIPVTSDMGSITQTYLTSYLHEKLRQYQQVYEYDSTMCKRSTMYECINSSKCISIHRLRNGVRDCPHSDDEDEISLNHTYSSLHSPLDVLEEVMNAEHARKHLLFQTICDGFTELSPININGRNETDETNCDYWSCDNIYTHCNGLSNCPNGADETDCNIAPSANCSSNEFPCVSPITNQFMCLSTKQVGDDKIDCLGASDKPALCRTEYAQTNNYNFYCRNPGPEQCVTFSELCNSNVDCFDGEDEQFCTTPKKYSFYSICWAEERSNATDVENFLCEQMKDYSKERIIHFTLEQKTKSKSRQTNERKRIAPLPIPIPIQPKYSFCYRGFPVKLWLQNQTKQACFCPPTYYGNRCQHQNQRISLSLKFQAAPNSWQTPFAIVILLVYDDNNEQIIDSYEQFTYLSVRDCDMKHHVYLTYADRPKNQTRNYEIRIDVYEKISLHYRGSFLFPVKFSFLPVHRLSFLINIPQSDANVETCSTNLCQNGPCRKYLNNKQRTFCQYPEIWPKHDCSNDSIPIGISSNNNRSICVCPMNKFGHRCLLKNTICDKFVCQNSGQCIPMDEYETTKRSSCICRRGFTGDYCEVNDTQLILSFDKQLVLPSSIFIHFIQVMSNSKPLRSTTFHTIVLQQNYLTILWSRIFHLIFIEFYPNNYYLALVQKNYTQSQELKKTISPSDRCLHINETLNHSISELALIHRIKYYHLPCRLYPSTLSCFYDDVHLCICYDFRQQRLANCFEFNHNMTFDCFGQNDCQNGGKCFQDTSKCPKKSMCSCPSCFYGRLCQFTTSGFGLSLDSILGHHVSPNVSITHQPIMVKISIALNIVCVVVGFTNGILSLITFKNKKVREIGCGLYLFYSSVASLAIMMFFVLKFWIFITAQTRGISNRLFLQIECVSLNFLLRIALNMDLWLQASVASERVVTVLKGARFVRKKSRTIAKFIITCLLVFNILASIHDPIHRRLIDEENNDNDEKRIWCIVTYSSRLQAFDYTVQAVQFFVPFLINLISATILLIAKTRRESNFQTQKSMKEILQENYRQHRHLFLAPIILVILALPRLIISFTSKCLKSSNNAWVYLIGYFISFIPSMLTFVIFILPSRFYRKEFSKSINNYRQTVRRHWQKIS